MPICIECRYPVQQLYTSYSRADDRSSGKGVRLTQCPQCKQFADKYVEHDFVVLFIDLVLIKPQVYRHLLFNRLETERDSFHPSVIRFAILLLLFDVYLTWARIERDLQNGPADSGTRIAGSRSLLTRIFGVSAQPDVKPLASPLHMYPLPLQYLFFLGLCAIETFAFHLPIRLLTSSGISRTPSPNTSDSTSCSQQSSVRADSSSTLFGYPYPNRVSTALLVSSCSKLFPVLMVIWNYDLPSSASALSWAVIINNIAALEILLDCGYLCAAVLVVIGACCRWFVGWTILSAAGLGWYGTGSEATWRILTGAGHSNPIGIMRNAGNEIIRALGFA